MLRLAPHSYLTLLSTFLLAASLIGCDSDPSTPLGGEVAGMAGAESGTQAGVEAGTQAGVEAGTQAGVDAGVEAGTQAGVEAGVEAGTQAGVEAGTQAGVEAGTQAGIEAGTQAGIEAGIEAGVEAGTESGTQAGTTPTLGCDPAWEGLEDQALLDELYAYTSSAYRPLPVELDLGGNPNRYTTARRAMFVDVERRDGGVYLLYTNTLYTLAEGDEPPHSVINCEHTWPRSKLVDDDEQPAVYEHQQSDLHHLYPTRADANSARGSLGYGEVTRAPDLSYSPSSLGLDQGGRPVFEPHDGVKGDLARTYFYMSTRWRMELNPREEEVMRLWHEQDPVDAWELERDTRVARLQGNHNPFVHCPSLVERVSDFTGTGVQEDLPLP
jgi:hypothetical protein